MLKAKGVEAGEERVLQGRVLHQLAEIVVHAPGGGEHALDTGGRGGCGEVLLGHLSELGEAVLGGSSTWLGFRLGLGLGLGLGSGLGF